MFQRAAKPDPYATPTPVQYAPPQCHLKISFLLGKYIDEKNNKHAEKVCASPETIVCHLKPVLAVWGDLTLAEFTVNSRRRVKEQCDLWRAGDGAEDKGRAQNTVRAYVSKFKTALKYCFDQEIVPEGVPFPKFAMPKSGPPRQRVLDPDTELPRLMAVLDGEETAPHTRLATLLLLITGQRRSAVAALQWKHVDFERRVIWFKETQAPGERTTKRRTDMPLDDFLFDLLTEAKAKADSEWVVSWRGEQVKDVYYSVKAALERAELGDVVPHDFRRTSATLVHRGPEGSMESAASHIGDSVAMARRHYVQDSAHTRLPGVEAVSSVVQSALKKAG